MAKTHYAQRRAWRAVICRTIPGIAVAAFCIVFATPQAHAQTIDYGALQALFGEPVTTSVTGSPQRASDVPASMIIVTQAEIRRSGARDIPGVLRHVPGVDTMQWAADNTDVSIRGYDQAYSARTLVLIDGRQVYADYYGLVPWSSLPVELSDIRQIEIVEGPNAALFGFNAVGGVINIITYNPLYDDVNTVSVRGGTQGLAEGSGVVTFRLGNAGALRLSGGVRSDSEFHTAIPALMNASRRSMNNRAEIDANAMFRIANNIDFGLEVSHSHVRENDLGPVYQYNDWRIETDSIKGQLTADTRIGLLKFTAYSNWYKQQSANDPVLGILDFHNQVTVIQGEDALNIGSQHTVRFAFEYRHNSELTTSVAGGDVFYDIIAASGMWKWQITPALSLTNALRFDQLNLGRSGSVPANYPFTNADWDRTITAFSFNSGLVWRIDDVDTLRFMAARGTQLPSLTDFGGFVVNSPFLHATGTPFINTSTVTNYELAIDHNFPSLSSRISASLFYQNSTDLINFQHPFLAGLYSAFSNVGKSDAVGLELRANGALTDAWTWSLAYRYESIVDKLSPLSANGRYFLDYQHTTPRNVIKAGLGWASGRWQTNAYLQYQSHTMGLRPALPFGTQLVPVDAYATLDGRIAYRLTDWATIAVSGQNLLTGHQRQTSARDVERQVFATLTFNF